MDYDKNRLLDLGFSEETIAQLDFACWDTYKQEGMKKKGNQMVPNCVPKSEHKESDEEYDFGPARIKSYLKWAKENPGKFNEGDIATAEMTPNYLPKEPGSKDLKNPQMGEQKIRMPRMEEIAKASNKNGQLAMMAAPNYSETEDFNDAFHSMEPNAQMVITQLRVIREKVDIMLGMLYPDDNLEPWVTTKVANASMGLAAASDYLRFGGEIQ